MTNPKLTRIRFKSRSGIKKKRKTHPDQQSKQRIPSEEPRQVHPYPRADVEQTCCEEKEAFRSSMEDAATCREAALYWEGVYGFPIHCHMDMDVEEVMEELWVRLHPEVLVERIREERKNREDREDRKDREDREDREREKREKRNVVGVRDSSEEEDYREAWREYLDKWARHSVEDDYIPCWPVIRQSMPVRAHDVEAFMRHAPRLKVERVRWHPDRMQRYFRGRLDEETTKQVTAVFQVVDSLFQEQRVS
ncbi:hypothetical protein K470DRAFT_136307 [Piedraia hortae CBS 480.64]|uniref:Uncharacterized protein n=1 Tax=Piedraia hortae CBS 480.64 TaxID=1314780 RepID=A0A6A7BUS1_9PEZI|nr:hypothetical protein K470DRAFT_136307 [Piedraia hortae CBS 480.64]